MRGWWSVSGRGNTPRPAFTAEHDWIKPNWPAPATVHACTTTRRGGISAPPYDSLNLSCHVGDAPSAVALNRLYLRRGLGLPEAPRWLQQTHGPRLVDTNSLGGETDPVQADGWVTGRPGHVCAILSADCLPILLCNRRGSRVGAVHAGWRGLAAGIIEAAVTAMDTAEQDLMAWLGPGIGARHFEVGEEVRAALGAPGIQRANAFAPSKPGRWFADLFMLARQRLENAGVRRIYGGTYCTYSDPSRFYSYRRDRTTGRMATLIWIDVPPVEPDPLAP